MSYRRPDISGEPDVFDDESRYESDDIDDITERLKSTSLSVVRYTGSRPSESPDYLDDDEDSYLNEIPHITVTARRPGLNVNQTDPHMAPSGPIYRKGDKVISEEMQWEIHDYEYEHETRIWVYYTLPWPENPESLPSKSFTEDQIGRRIRPEPYYEIDDKFRDRGREKWIINAMYFDASRQVCEWYYEMVHHKGKYRPEWTIESELHKWKRKSSKRY
ncbi:hypothetical protein H072_360 [Dactylellina haptotyla CBS 200.50]|uniref:Uncharacterized protein n=1 Tax=Dactylellina haptotyla (strain CBS 200.50) TaxID=1284197 RepID=S8AXE4_DACHA|nr:hypothetical protein H072_360 [Dactylellina haptotyla CBS 200.50]